MSIPDETIDAIRNRADIVAVVSRYVTLRRRGRSFVGLCPFHAEKTPSFSVFPERGSWHCFGCGAGGNVFTFLMRMDSLTFPEAVERLGREVGVEVRRDRENQERRSLRQQLFEVNEAAARFFADQLRRSAVAQEAVRRRGLTDETVQELGLGYAPDSWDALASTLMRRGIAGRLLEQAGLARPRESGSYYDVFRHRLIFPIRDVEGRVVAFGGRALGDVQPKYLNSRETPVFDKGRTLYGLDRARRAIAEAGEAIVVEGYMDAVTAHQAGVRNVVATLGTAFGASHLELLRRYDPRRVVLAYDGDAAGVAAAERALTVFESAGMSGRAYAAYGDRAYESTLQQIMRGAPEGRILMLPAGMDPDEFIRERGADAFREAVQRALPLVEFLIRRFTARADVSTPEGRLALAHAVGPLLATIDNAVRREEYITRLAEEWCAGQLHRVREVEEAIRREVRRAPRRGGPPGATDRSAGQPGEPAERQVLANAHAIPQAVVVPRDEAERLVLRGLLFGDVRREDVFAELNPDDLGSPECQRLATLIWRHRDAIDLAGAVAQACGPEDGAVIGLLSVLQSEQEARPVTQNVMEDALWDIKERKLQARIGELQSALMRSDLPLDEYSRMGEEKRELVRELGRVRAIRGGIAARRG